MRFNHEFSKGQYAGVLDPEFDDFDEDESDTVCGYINDRFTEEGIYIPTWHLDVTDEWLERVDLMPPYWHKR